MPRERSERGWVSGKAPFPIWVASTPSPVRSTRSTRAAAAAGLVAPRPASTNGTVGSGDAIDGGTDGIRGRNRIHHLVHDRRRSGDFGLRHVFGDLDQHSAAGWGVGPGQGRRDRDRRQRRIGQCDGRVDEGPGRSDDVDDLERPLVVVPHRLLAGHRQHRYTHQLGLGQRREQVERPRAERGQADRRSTGEPGAGHRHEPGVLLVTTDDQRHVGPVQGRDQRQVLLAGEGEDHLHAAGDEGGNDGVGRGPARLVRSHRFLTSSTTSRSSRNKSTGSQEWCPADPPGRTGPGSSIRSPFSASTRPFSAFRPMRSNTGPSRGSARASTPRRVNSAS